MKFCKFEWFAYIYENEERGNFIAKHRQDLQMTSLVDKSKEKPPNGYVFNTGPLIKPISQQGILKCWYYKIWKQKFIVLL